MGDDLVKQALAELGDVVRCRCAPGYKNMGRRDPSCECDSADAVKIVADRIEELEAKLAKAVSFIEFLDENYRHALGDTARMKIRRLYAELKGETDE